MPEIALTPQTVRRFVARFGHVAVLHSGLTAASGTATGNASPAAGRQVVVGARLGRVRPGPQPGRDRRRRGARAELQAGHGPPLPRPRRGHQTGPARGRPRHPRQRHAVAGVVITGCPSWVVGCWLGETPLQRPTPNSLLPTIQPPDHAHPRPRPADAARGADRHAAGEPLPPRRPPARPAARAPAPHHGRQGRAGHPAAEPPRLQQLRLLRQLRRRAPVQVLRRDHDLPPHGRGERPDGQAGSGPAHRPAPVPLLPGHPTRCRPRARRAARSSACSASAPSGSRRRWPRSSPT